jgi:DNA-binding LacI/PurR family transcriptional regulator
VGESSINTVESSLPLPSKARRPDYQRITKELRQEIISGRYVPGMQLPSTEELAVTWKSSVYTVHTALAALAKEGWIDRIQGTGTYVAEPQNRFTCAGIYHEADIGSNRLSNYVRSIHDCLLEQFAALKKETQIFIDSRPLDKRRTVLPAMLEAIQNRHIQCVIAPTATFEGSPELAKLTLPTAFAGNPGSVNRVDFDKDDFLRESLRCLARQGCRSAGLIAPITHWTKLNGVLEVPVYRDFDRLAREEGLMTCPEWVSDVYDDGFEHEGYGYREFQKLWKLGDKPDGMIVFPDTSARGVITAVLKFGIDVVPRKMKFVFHRNAHMNLLCPFPVTWGISDEDELARKLIEIIETQFRGEKVTPILLPYKFEADDASRWK